MISNNITPIIVVMGVLLAIGLAVIIYLFYRTRRLELECELLLRGSEGTNFVEIVNDNIDQVRGLFEEVDQLSERYAAVLRRVAGAVQHVGVVRFDAFRDLGGLLSFAVALLDDRGNGLVFSSIYGRSESRTYAKPVIERSSSYELSPEEREAIRLAMQSKEMGALPVEAKDREHEERMANLRLFHDREYLARSPEPRSEAEAHILSEHLDVEARPPRPAPDRSPARPPAREQDRERPATVPSRRRKPGRVSHVGPPDKTKREPEGGSLEDTVAQLLEPESDLSARPSEHARSSERSVPSSRARQSSRSRPSEREKPLERRSEPAKDKPVRRSSGPVGKDRHVPQRKPAEPRPGGLDTPVERLRNRENE